MTAVAQAAVTKVGFGVTSILGYIATAIPALIVAIEAIDGANITLSNPLAAAAIILGAVTTFIRGLQGAAKAHANNPGL